MTNPEPPLITFSIVSHGHGRFVADLLNDLVPQVDVPAEYLLTLNRPEDEAQLRLDRFPAVRVTRNAAPKGFGANHNAAFGSSSAPYFCILNPDLRVPRIDLARLLDTLSGSNVGAVGPLVLNGAGGIEDSARLYPGPLRLFRRVVLRRRNPDYPVSGATIDVEWLAGMFLLFRAEAYRQLGGFDERYFMYLEDTDICRRMAQAGWRVVQDQAVSVVHDGQRASHRSIRHLRWHLSSLARFMWRSLRIATGS